jgi:sarcosine oxidase subunit beta
LAGCRCVRQVAVLEEVEELFDIRVKLGRIAKLLELEPGLGTNVNYALYCPSDGVAPQEQTTSVLAAAAMRAGAQIVESAPALKLTWSGSRVAAVETPGRSYFPRKGVIVAANAGTSALLAGVGASIPGWNVVPQVTFIEPLNGHTITHLIQHDSRVLSLKAGPNGTVQVSGGWRGRWNASKRIGEVDEAIVDAAVAAALAVYPEFASARVVSSDASRVETCAPDTIPVIDQIPGTDNLYVASQWAGHGFALLPAVDDVRK